MKGGRNEKKTLTLVRLYSMVPSNAFEHITLSWEGTDV